MSRAHSNYIPAEQVENATDWNFAAVDQAALRFAAKLKAQALAEERARDDTARKSGYAEGHAAGFAKGRAEGHAEATLLGQQKLDDYVATQGAAAAQQMVALFTSAQDQLAECEQAMARGVLELACEVARQVLRRELSVNPNVLQPVVREALGMLSVDHKAAALRLHPHDMDVLADDLQREFTNLAITLVPDSTLTPGGCLVESSGAVIDGSIERRWQRAVASLGLDAAWEQPAKASDDVA